MGRWGGGVLGLSLLDLFCKFVIVYGIHTFLDPVLIAIVDAPLGVSLFPVRVPREGSLWLDGVGECWGH